MYHQHVTVEGCLIAVEGAAVAGLGDATVVEVVGVAALAAGGEAFFVDMERR